MNDKLRCFCSIVLSLLLGAGVCFAKGRRYVVVAYVTS